MGLVPLGSSFVTKEQQQLRDHIKSVEQKLASVGELAHNKKEEGEQGGAQ